MINTTLCYIQRGEEDLMLRRVEKENDLNKDKCDEGVLEWVHRDRLLELPHWEGDAIFLDLLQQEAPFFSLKVCYEGDRLAGAVLNGRTI